MIANKKTKIVATLGPASEKESTIKAMIQSGMNVARLNFSHGTHEEHKERLKIIRKLSDKLDQPVAIIQDLCGPKIRIGDFSESEVHLKKGQTFILTTKKCSGSDEKVWINYAKLPQEVKKGNSIFLDDGKVKLKVQSVRRTDVTCKVLIGGYIKGRRGVNIPDADLSIRSLTAKDKKDAEFGMKQDVDFMALSFVRTASDVLDLKKILVKKKLDKKIKIISKIETPQALDNIDEIIEHSHGIMIARGDLAVEVPPEEVPIIQKDIIVRCNKLGKPVITATQMLETMVHSSTPTRAEVNDVANAILDGTDAVMLSGETAQGNHPVEAVRVMDRVARHTEKHFPYEDILRREHLGDKEIAASVTYGAVTMGHELNAKLVIALSLSGYSARMISRFRPKIPILVVTPDEKTYNRMALQHNCYPVLADLSTRLAFTLAHARKFAKELGLAKKGDTVVVVTGIPFSQRAITNLVLVQTI